MMLPSSEIIVQLLMNAGLQGEYSAIEVCQRGGNNRTYRVKTPQGQFALKQYFNNPKDERNRLNSEFSFLSYANQVAPYYVPAALSKQETAGIALYEFIEGEPFSPHDITEHEVKQAIDFFCALNQPHLKATADHLPVGSEACFSLQTHLDIVEKRIHDLRTFEAQSEEDQLAEKLIQYLHQYWLQLSAYIKAQARQFAFDLHQPLHASQRCISPSDFGFHNALKKADGTIKFLDFEYAGWDDPAKMVGDFFAQLAVPVPSKYFNYFIDSMMNLFSDPEHFKQRATLLKSVYQVKWCCIALNIFIPINLQRRQFANPALDIKQLKCIQLSKAQTIIDNLEFFSHG